MSSNRCCRCRRHCRRYLQRHRHRRFPYRTSFPSSRCVFSCRESLENPPSQGNRRSHAESRRFDVKRQVTATLVGNLYTHTYTRTPTSVTRAHARETWRPGVRSALFRRCRLGSWYAVWRLVICCRRALGAIVGEFRVKFASRDDCRRHGRLPRLRHSNCVPSDVGKTLGEFEGI